MSRHYISAALAAVLFLGACSASRPSAPPGCKLDRIACPAGMRCNVFSDLCEPCADGGECDDSGAR